jgi:hypothetical protein
MDYLFWSTLLYTMMVFDEWQNGVPIEFIVIGKTEKMTTIESYNHYHIKCQMIGCHLLLLSTTLKLKSMS